MLESWRAEGSPSPDSPTGKAHPHKETIMTLEHRSAARGQAVRASVRASDGRTRDAGKVQFGGVIKKLPVSPPDAATRDKGKVQVGGVIKKLPVSPPDAATRDKGKVQIGGVIKRL